MDEHDHQASAVLLELCVSGLKRGSVLIAQVRIHGAAQRGDPEDLPVRSLCG